MEISRIIDEFDEIVYVSDINTYELLYMNAKCKEVVGITTEVFNGEKCYALLQGFDAPCPFCNNHLLSYDSIYQWEYYNAHLDISFSNKDKKIKWKGRDARIEFAVDISSYKQELKSAESHMASLIQSIPGSICRLSYENGAILIHWHNNQFLELIGYTEEQFDTELGRQALYLLPKDRENVLNLLETVAKTRTRQTIELRVLQRNGDIRNLFTTMSFLSEHDGCAHFYSVGQDITEFRKREELHKKELEQALTQAQLASEAKGRFLSRMSHEIRTPLSAIIGMATLARNDLDKTELVTDCHKKIESSAHYLLSLVNDILDVSRIESGKMLLARQTFSMPDLMNSVEALFTIQAHEREVQLQVSSQTLPEENFYGDPLRVKQVLINLLSNALKFTPPGGQVTLSCRQLSVENQRVWFEFAVTDSGIGMQAEFLDRVFEVFEQENSGTANRYGGSGLGLSICKQLVELMHGSIHVSSQVGVGSRFEVCIPLDIATEPGQPNPLSQVSLQLLPPSASQTPNQAIPQFFDGKHVLLAEDDEINRFVAIQLLQSRHFTVDVATNGQEALQAFAASPEGFYDTILMDIRMPILDGHSATRALRALPRPDAARVPIIALSANAFEEDRAESLSHGMTEHVSKPIDIDMLCALLHTLFI